MGGGKQPSKICTVTREELHVPGITRLPKELNTQEEEKENIKGKWKNPPTPPTPLHLLYSWASGDSPKAIEGVCGVAGTFQF